MKTLTKKQTEFMLAAREMFGEAKSLSREDILAVCAKYKLKEPQWLVKPSNRIGRGVYSLPGFSTKSKPNAVVQNIVQMERSETKTTKTNVKPAVEQQKANKLTISDSSYEGMIPSRDKNFVRFGIYSDLKVIIQSKVFYPVFISGLSGNGKSFTPEQICAELKREFFRVNITKNTNEDDLLGGYRLINGETVWFDGPVVQAAERGAILVLDEIDYGSNEITCMQNVLEGKPFLIKKINKVVTPLEGFNIIATANTKGQGDTLGKFVFTNVLNEAFLERFSVTLDQEYPPKSVEQKILTNYLRTFNVEADKAGDFADKLVQWANTNRDTFKAGAINEILSTRRLVHIIKAFAMFNDRKKAVEICLNRFDSETKQALFDLWQKIDAVVVDNSIKSENVVTGAPEIDPVDGGTIF